MVERGFCQGRDMLAPLRAAGLPDQAIWLEGRGAEDLEGCIGSFRGRPGTLLVAPDLRVFGQSIKSVEVAMARLEKLKIRVVDIIHPQHETVAEMLGFARARIGGTRFRDRRTARRRGATGGLAKGEAARSARAQIDTDTLIRNLVAEYEAIGWPVIRRICGGHLNESTLRRHYLGHGAMAKPRRRQ